MHVHISCALAGLYKPAAMSLLELGPIIFGPERSDRIPAKQAPDCTQHAMPAMLDNNEFTNPR